MSTATVYTVQGSLQIHQNYVQIVTNLLYLQVFHPLPYLLLPTQMASPLATFPFHGLLPSALLLLCRINNQKSGILLLQIIFKMTLHIYIVQMSVGGSSSFTQVFSGSDLSYTVTNLLPSTVYGFKVAAVCVCVCVLC